MMDDGTTQSALRHCVRPPDLDELMNSAAARIDKLEDGLRRINSCCVALNVPSSVIESIVFETLYGDDKAEV